MQRIFTHIRQVNLWESSESASGRGSELTSTESIRTSLPQLFEKLNITSILDAPCGDFNWIRHISLEGMNYLGIDVVPDIIQANQQRYASATIQFQAGDITQTALPQSDLIICRDCLVHLPLQMGCMAVRQFKRSQSTYLLTTTYPETQVNRDAPVGSWRSLNLCLAPFNFPEPLILFSDPSDDTGAHPDKSMGLWLLDGLETPEIPRWSSPQVLLINLIRQYINPSWQL